jgi:hypothetical protein
VSGEPTAGDELNQGEEGGGKFILERGPARVVGCDEGGFDAGARPEPSIAPEPITGTEPGKPVMKRTRARPQVFLKILPPN